MLRGREPGHVDPGFGHMMAATMGLMPGIIQAFRRLRERSQFRLDPFIDRGDIGVYPLDLRGVKGSENDLVHSPSRARAQRMGRPWPNFIGHWSKSKRPRRPAGWLHYRRESGASPGSQHRCGSSQRPCHVPTSTYGPDLSISLGVSMTPWHRTPSMGSPTRVCARNPGLDLAGGARVEVRPLSEGHVHPALTVGAVEV